MQNIVNYIFNDFIEIFFLTEKHRVNLINKLVLKECEIFPEINQSSGSALIVPLDRR